MITRFQPNILLNTTILQKLYFLSILHVFLLTVAYVDVKKQGGLPTGYTVYNQHRPPKHAL